jgi:hypothetical protein
MIGQLILFIFLFGPPLIIIGLISKQRRISDPKKSFQSACAMVFGLTLGYFFWESKMGGNIRIDLLVMYPCLLIGYILLLWPRLHWFSIVVAALLMSLNIWFMSHSYSWFHKSYG